MLKFISFFFYLNNYRQYIFHHLNLKYAYLYNVKIHLIFNPEYNFYLYLCGCRKLSVPLHHILQIRKFQFYIRLIRNYFFI